METVIRRDGPTTTARVRAEDGAFLDVLDFVGEGKARCRPTDYQVRNTGDMIATGRALQDFGRQVEEAGLRESVGKDDVERVVKAMRLRVLDQDQAPRPS